MGDGNDPFALVEEGDEYALFSLPGEAAYRLHYKTDRLMARLQGDDAIRFRNDYRLVRQHYPGWTPDQALAQLWDQGGYGWLAEGAA